MKKSFFLLLLLLFTFSGCISAPAPEVTSYIHVTKSEFDNATEISMEPAVLSDSPTEIKLHLFRRSTMPIDQIILTVIVDGAHYISSGESLHLNIDDTLISFRSIDDLPDMKTTPGSYYSDMGIYMPPAYWSSKRYVIDRTFLKRMIDAEKVVVRVDLRTTYIEGVFSVDDPNTALPAFKEFYRTISTE